jgi:hypothetical protein
MRLPAPGTAKQLKQDPANRDIAPKRNSATTRA